MNPIYKPGETTPNDLTAEEEIDLILDARAPDGKEALEELSRCFILVATQAARTEGKPTGIPDDVLVSCAHDGLLRAVEDFDPARGTRFSSYVYRRSVWMVRRWRKANGSHEAKKRLLMQENSTRKLSAPNERTEHFNEQCATVREVLHQLPPVERDVISRRLAGQTLADIAKEHGLSVTRISQIEGAAALKLSKLVTK